MSLILMRPDGVSRFAGDLSEHEQKVLWATHYTPAADLFARNAEGVAWRSKPGWYTLATQHRTVQPELQRFVAKRMRATVKEVASSEMAANAVDAVVLRSQREVEMADLARSVPPRLILNNIAAARGPVGVPCSLQ